MKTSDRSMPRRSRLPGASKPKMVRASHAEAFARLSRRLGQLSTALLLQSSDWKQDFEEYKRVVDIRARLDLQFYGYGEDSWMPDDDPKQEPAPGAAATDAASTKKDLP